MQAKVPFVFSLMAKFDLSFQRWLVIIGLYDNQNSYIAKVLANKAMKKSHIEFDKML